MDGYFFPSKKSCSHSGNSNLPKTKFELEVRFKLYQSWLLLVDVTSVSNFYIQNKFCYCHALVSFEITFWGIWKRSVVFKIWPTIIMVHPQCAGSESWCSFHIQGGGGPWLNTDFILRKNLYQSKTVLIPSFGGNYVWSGQRISLRFYEICNILLSK